MPFALRRFAVIPVVVAALALAACAPAAPASEAEPTATSPAPTDDRTLRTLIEAPAAEPELTVGAQRADDGSGLLRYDVTYASGDLQAGAILDLPAGEGPFPAVVLVHGHIPPEQYDAGTVMLAEQQALVAAGYAVLHLDLRGWGASDPDPDPSDQEVGFGEDVASAVRALAAGAVPQVDPDRLALVGHSRGGRSALNGAVVAGEDLDAVIALAPSPVDAWVNLNAFSAWALDADGQFGTRGTPETQPAFWRDVNPSTFADRVEAPVLFIQGDADDVILPEWTDAAVDAWNEGGGDAELVTIPGADHLFAPSLDEVLTTAIGFLDAHL